VPGIIVEYSFDVTRKARLFKHRLTGCCHPIADPPSGEKTGNRDSVDGLYCARLSQGKAPQSMWRRHDGQLNHSGAARDVPGPFNTQIDIRVHTAQHRREHMLQVVRRRCKVLEHTSSIRALTGASAKHATGSTLSASIVVDPAVPMFQSNVPPETRAPGVKVNSRLSTCTPSVDASQRAAQARTLATCCARDHGARDSRGR
jgi:hypothetical protein